jgi:hypothetical protein
MMKSKHILWLGFAALLLLATGCPVTINDEIAGDDDGPGTAECEKSSLSTVRFFHAAGGTPVTRPEFGPATTRQLQIVRLDLPMTPTIATMTAGRAVYAQICGNKQIMLGARLAGAEDARAMITVTLTPDADPTAFDASRTMVLAGISDDLKADGTPENPKSVADPLRFIDVLDTFGTGSETQIQVVHASRKTPMQVDVEVNPDRAMAEITALTRYGFSAVAETKGTADTMPSAVPVQFLEGTAVRAMFSIAPRIPTSAKVVAIHFDTEVFDPDNPDPAARNPPTVARLFITGDDPLLGKVAGGGIQF